MICLGVDPDLHNTGWALVESGDSPVVLAVGVAKVSGRYKGTDAIVRMSKSFYSSVLISDLDDPDLVVVEGQEIYVGKSKARHSDILSLAQAAGVCLGLLAHCYPSLLPKPKEWKGEVPKQTHQSRVLQKLHGDWTWEKIGSQKDGYCNVTSAPSHLSTLNKTAWKHVIDAIGLACWGLSKGSRSASFRAQTSDLK